MSEAPELKQNIYSLLDKMVELSGEEEFSSPLISITDIYNNYNDIKSNIINKGENAIELVKNDQFNLPIASISKDTIIKGNTVINLLERHVGIKHDVQENDPPEILNTDYGVKINFSPEWNFNNTTFVIGGNRLTYKLKTGTQYTFSIEANLENVRSIKGKLHIGTLDNKTEVSAPIDITIEEGQNRFVISTLGVISENKVDCYMHLDNLQIELNNENTLRHSITLGNPMLIEGHYLDNYINYISGMESVAEKGFINILAIGKNFLDERKIVTNLSFKGYKWHSGLSPIRIFPNRRYILTNGSRQSSVYVIYYNRDMDIIKEEETKEILTPTNCTHIKLFGSTKPNNILLEMTDELPSNYERYKFINKIISTNPLRYINEKFYDRLLNKNMVPVKEKKVGELILGERTVYLEYCPGFDKPNTKLFRCKVEDMLPFKLENSFSFKCDSIKVGKKDMDDRATISGDPANPKYIYVRIESMFINNNPEDINNYFEANKTRILYPLEETIYEPLEYNNSIDLFLRKGTNTIFFLDNVYPSITGIIPTTIKSFMEDMEILSKNIPTTNGHLFTRNLYKFNCRSYLYSNLVNEDKKDYCMETLDRSGIYRFMLMDLIDNKSIGAGAKIGFEKNSFYNNDKVSLLTKNNKLSATNNTFEPNNIPIGSKLSFFKELYCDNTIILGAGSERPITNKAGSWFFDTNIKKPIWWNGKNWTDIEGNKC